MPPAAAPTTSAAAMQNLSGYQSSMKTPDQAATDANTALGVTGAQQTATGLQGAIQRTTSLLNNVAPSVMGRTANSLVTDAQATRQIGNESAPIQADLSKNTSDYNAAEADLQTKEKQAEARAANTLSGQQGQLSYLQNIYNNLYTQEQDKAKAAESAAALAEQAREFNATPHGGAGSSGMSPTLTGATPTTAGFKPANGYAMTSNPTGGLAFAGPNGKPVTAAQFVSAGGGSVSDLAQVLSQSKDPGDAKILQALRAGTPVAQLKAQYPYVFGGV